MAEALYQPFPLPGTARAHIWRHVPETRRPRHFHAEPELNLIAAGTATFGVGASTIAVAAGDLLWWSPGQDHVLLEASPDFDLFVVGLTPELSARVLGAGDAAAGGELMPARLSPEALAHLRALCAAPPAVGDSAAVERHVGDLWRDAHAMRATHSGRPRHAVTRRALASILEHPELSRTEVAVAVRGHPTEVSRYFHRDMRLTLTSYRTRLRLLRFIEAVDGGAPTLLTAALEAGFGSYSQCHRSFLNTLGHSPRQFFATDLRAQMRDALAPDDAR